MLRATVQFQPTCCGRAGIARRGGLVLSWLLLVALGIIWAVFLFPSRRRSPASSVEEFERKMSLLKETQLDPSPGRWVLVPRKGERFLGAQDRLRARARRRRRLVFTILVEASALTFLMGLFPPFRKMLLATALLVGLLAVYTLTLVRIRAIERHQARIRRRMAARVPTNGNGLYAAAGGRTNGRGRGHPAGRETFLGNGHGWSGELRGGGVRIIEEDVHVVVRTSGEVEREAVLAAAASARSQVE